jgi:type 1 glutamine amidotransferase
VTTSHTASLVRIFALAGCTLTLACSESGGGGGSGGSGGASASGGSGGRGGSGGSGGSSAGSGGSGGSSAGSGGSSAGSGGSGGSAGGSGGSTGGTGSGGSAGSGGSGGSGGATGGSGGSSMGDARPAEMGASEGGGNTSNRILFYTRTAGQTHVAGIATAVAEMTKLLGPAGLMADTTNDPAMITQSNLAKYAGVVLISTSGTPFGMPGTAQIEALTAFVRGGGGLAGFHAASNTDYQATGPFTMLLGADMRDQGGGFRTSDCYPEAGMHATVAKLPNPYRVMNEEFYTFDALNPANQIVLRCVANTGTDRIPIAWVREEGAGRVFYTGLGHQEPLWTGGRFLTDHAWPGVLWTIKK